MTFSIATIRQGAARLGFCPLPGRNGDASADIAALLDWSPDVVVSLTETPEMAAFGMERLGERLAQLEIAWAHFPIGDYAVPDPSADWTTLAARLHPVLDQGGGALVHCMGGKGRSGMVVLRLLTERGENAAAVLSRLRRLRPGAVETGRQYQWAAGN